MTEPVSVGTPNVEAANALWEAVLEWKLRQSEPLIPANPHEENEFESVVPVSALSS